MQSLFADPIELRSDTGVTFVDIDGEAYDELQWQCFGGDRLWQITIACDSDILLPILRRDSGAADTRVSGKYFYHTDHLGSANWVTKDDEAVQFIHYMPYGEMWYNQRGSAYNERYKYTGKERDEETGNDYFGARYYAAYTPMWLSPDPLMDKYPSISPYAYCSWNPIRFIDPDGQDWIDPGDGNISWNDKATSQEAMNKAGIQGLYLGKDVLVGKHGRDNNLNEKINGAIFELYLETNKEGATASIKGNTIPCDVDKYGTLKEGRYPAVFQKYHDMPAIYIVGDLPTVNGNPNNRANYIDHDIKKPMIPVEQQIMNGIFFHYGNNYFEGLIDSHGIPWTTGCQTGGNYKGSWTDYRNFMQNVPATFNGWYYLRAR